MNAVQGSVKTNAAVHEQPHLVTLATNSEAKALATVRLLACDQT